MNPTTRDIHIDKALSNVAIAYKQESFIADQLFPMVSVDHQSDKYFIFTKDYWFRNSVVERAPGTLYGHAGYKLSNDEYFCKQYALAHRIPVENIDNQDAVVQLETRGAEFLATQHLLNREIKLAAKVFDASAWGSSSTKSGTSQWSDFENSTPITDIITGVNTVKKAIGMKPNVCLMGTEVWDKLCQHPDLLELFKYTNQAMVKVSQFAELFGFTKVLIGDSIYNTSAEGQTFSGSFVWPAHVLLAYVNPTPAINMPSAGYTFVWKENGYAIPIVKYFDEDSDSTVLKSKHCFDQKVVASDCGYEILNAVA